jgi:alkanesulfonate monooxygenase SsuD/methylene tetrahydromethanopterin reductase-like flavin-dependent oxidoreductase (luciferase family)
MVTSAGFRNPAFLAKVAATVDVISKGRLNFGIGAGIQEKEHIAYGYSFPKPRVRIRCLKETIEIAKNLWTQEKVNYKGEIFRLVDATCEPKPIQQPHPPIIIGGGGEKFTLKVTAQHGDGFDFGYLPTMKMFKQKLGVLEKHCRVFGRSFDAIEKSCWPAGQILLGKDREEVEKKIQQFKPKGLSQKEFESFTFAGTPEKLRERLQAYRDLGVTRFLLFFRDLPDLSSLTLFDEAVANDVV